MALNFEPDWVTIISSPRTSTCSEGMRYRLSNPAPRPGWDSTRDRIGCSWRRLPSAPFLSPCRLWFTDNGHINVRGRPGDVNSLALSDRGLRVTRRNVYDPTIVRRRMIVLALGGERGDAKANNKCGDEKKLRHLATFLCGRTNQPQYELPVPRRSAPFCF